VVSGFMRPKEDTRGFRISEARGGHKGFHTRGFRISEARGGHRGFRISEANRRTQGVSGFPRPEEYTRGFRFTEARGGHRGFSDF
jgi:hypothetical protein